MTVDQRGGRETRVERGTQWRMVPGAGSGRGAVGVNWRKTVRGKGGGSECTEGYGEPEMHIPKGERIMRRRLPSEVVISRSSSWPTQV